MLAVAVGCGCCEATVLPKEKPERAATSDAMTEVLMQVLLLMLLPRGTILLPVVLIQLPLLPSPPVPPYIARNARETHLTFHTPPLPPPPRYEHHKRR